MERTDPGKDVLEMRQILKDRTLRRLALINCFFGMTEATFAFRATFLTANGVTAAQTGVIFAVTSVIGVLAPILGGALADRFLSRYQVFLISLFGFAFVFGFMPLSATIRIGSIILAMILMPMIQLFHPVGSVMIATCSVNAVMSRKNVDYSYLRLFMSSGYTIANLAYTPLMKRFGVNVPFYCSLIFFTMIFFLRSSIRDSETVKPAPGFTEAEKKKNRAEKPKAASPESGEPRFISILQNYYIVTFVLITVIYAAAGNCFAFLSYMLEEKGIDSANIGVVAGLKVVGEVMAMLVMPSMKKKISLSGLQFLAGGFLCLELLSNSLAGSFGAIIFSEVLGGIGNGIALATAGLYVREMAPKGLEATAQSLWSVGTSFGSIILSLVFGQIVENRGIVANYRFGLLLQFSWLFLFAATLLFGKYVLKKDNVCPLFLIPKKRGEGV